MHAGRGRGGGRSLSVSGLVDTLGLVACIVNAAVMAQSFVQQQQQQQHPPPTLQIFIHSQAAGRPASQETNALRDIDSHRQVTCASELEASRVYARHSVRFD